ncbi:hypothetical protein EVAR_42747_1 [Eumeta japonica]|uniref:Uncharacterized protein n=1 Tax=Eumeta variegata TaxID=151549 RepID=A0A4C1XIW6_EUMVA|nr:hypothetical protein EVAR_42747_1 [Eumeta japonica]
MSRAVGTHTCRPAALGEAIEVVRPVARLVFSSVLEMASLRSPTTPTDGYKRFNDDLANASVNNYGSNITSNDSNKPL